MQIKNIKVLHIISSLGMGGAERQLLELTQDNNNHGICQLMQRESWSDNFLKDKNRVFSLGMKKGIPDPRAFSKLKRTIEIFKPNIINTWMYHASLLEVLLRQFGKNKNIPLVWGIRCSNMDTKYYTWQLKMVIKACKFFSFVPNTIVSNSAVGETFHKKLGFKNKKFKIVNNGINTDKFKPDSFLRETFRKRWKIKNSTKVFVCVARVDPMKDHSTLLSAFSQAQKIHNDVTLFLIGNKTNSLTETKGVISLGQCKNVEEIYPGADSIISSSAFGEGFSNAIAEGMSSGLVPIATKVGDSEKIIGHTGILIKPQDVIALTNAIDKVVTMSKQKLEAKKYAVRNRIIHNFSRSRMLEAYNKIYIKLMDNS